MLSACSSKQQQRRQCTAVQGPKRGQARHPRRCSPERSAGAPRSLADPQQPPCDSRQCHAGSVRANGCARRYLYKLGRATNFELSAELKAHLDTQSMEQVEQYFRYSLGCQQAAEKANMLAFSAVRDHKCVITFCPSLRASRDHCTPINNALAFCFAVAGSRTS